MILSTRSNGLEFVGINVLSQEVMGKTKWATMFKEMYGSESAVFADLLWDLSTIDIAEARPTDTENMVSDLKNYSWLAAIFLDIRAILHG